MKKNSITPLILAITVTIISYIIILPNASAFSTDQAQQVLAGVQGAMILLPLGIGFATFMGATSIAHISALPSLVISGATAVIIFIAMWSVVPIFVQNMEVAQDAAHPTPARTCWAWSVEKAAAFGSIITSKYFSSQYHILIYVTIFGGVTAITMLVLRLVKE